MVNIGILGLGTVGTGVVKLLEQNRKIIFKRCEKEIFIKKVLVKSKNKKRDIPKDKICFNANQILEDDDISIVVEVMGGEEPALSYIKKALASGKHVVTANKEIVAKHGKELFELATNNHVSLLFEASVAGGIPIIRPMKYCLASNDVTKIMGILNGTTNYILTQMTEKGTSFDNALKKAQEEGFAESDPTADIMGYDAARKLAILSSIAFNTRISFEKVYAEGIDKLEIQDINYAKEMGYTIKLLATGKRADDGVEVSVTPMFLKETHPLAGVRDEFNAILVEGNAVGSVMFYGAGAGMMPTASAVVADIMDIARNGNNNKTYCTCFNNLKIKDPSFVKNSFYIRLWAKDAPGVLSKISGVLGEKAISLSKVFQKNTKNGFAEIVLVTYDVLYKNIKEAIEEIKNLDVIEKVSNVIRVEEA